MTGSCIEVYSNNVATLAQVGSVGWRGRQRRKAQ
jgi:hypothetical protein